MSAFSVLVITIIKPTLLCTLAVFIWHSTRRESPAWQHQQLIILIFLMPLLWITFAYLPKNVHVPVNRNNPWLETIPAATLINFGAISLAVSLTLILYRLLTLIRLAKQEAQYPPAPESVQCIIRSLGNEDFINNIDPRIKPPTPEASSEQINAYVWQPAINQHRLILSDRILDLPIEQQQCIIAHECAHIARKDWMTQQLAYGVACLFWFVAPVWWWLNIIYQLAEKSADDIALDSIDKIKSGNIDHRYSAIYVETLLSIKTNSIKPKPTTGIMYKNGFYSRLQYLLNTIASHQPLEPIERFSSWLICAVLCAPLLIVNPILIQEQVVSFTKSHMLWFQSNQSQETQPNIPALAPYIKLAEPAVVVLPQPPRTDSSSLAAHTKLIPPEQLHHIGAAHYLPSGIQAPKPIVSLHSYLPIIHAALTYPERALNAGIEGKVSVRFSIDQNGRAFSIEILDAKPRGWFEQAVLSGLARSQFQPLVANNQSVILRGVTEYIAFSLID